MPSPRSSAAGSIDPRAWPSTPPATSTSPTNGNTISKIAPPVLIAGQPFSGTVFRFTDSDPQATASDFTAVVTLGDGNSVTLNTGGVVSGPAGAGGQIVADPNGGFDVQLSYTYAKALSNQTFAVKVTELDGDLDRRQHQHLQRGTPVRTATTVNAAALGRLRHAGHLHGHRHRPSRQHRAHGRQRRFLRHHDRPRPGIGHLRAAARARPRPGP